MAKISRERWKVFGDVFDEFTERILFKMASQGYFEELESPIKIGKEANVFSARTAEGGLVAVKIYRLEAADFKKMYQYITSDSRYYDVRHSRRQIIFTWVQREYRNLLKAREAGVRVPMPIAINHHVLLMEHIGEGSAAPQLKDAVPSRPDQFFKAVVKYMRLLYQRGRLVHSDLSAFNILNLHDAPVFIDLSQGITTDSYASKEFLERDIRNVGSYFSRLDVAVDEAALFKEITSSTSE